jgi:hypothetical protein
MRPLITLFWRDAHFEFDLAKLDDLTDDYIVQTFGLIIHEDDRFVTIAAEVLPGGKGWRGVTRIPTHAIQRRQTWSQNQR